jgi:class 3 adenylate cyclase
VDSIGDAYLVIALGHDGGPPSPDARRQLLSAALAMRAAVRRIDAAAAAATGRCICCRSDDDGGCDDAAAAGGGGGSGRLQLRIGVAEGDVMTGVTGAHRQRFQCLGDALARAEGLQRSAAPDEISVHPRSAAAAAAHFHFAPSPAADGAGEGVDGDAVGLALLGELDESEGGGCPGEGRTAMSAVEGTGVRRRDAKAGVCGGGGRC